MSEAASIRRTPTPTERKEILELQQDRCLYCDRLFGTAVIRKEKLVFLRTNFDHFVPFSYSQNNYAYNFVAACQICNGIKSNLMFKTLEEARVYVRAMWDAEYQQDDSAKPDKSLAYSPSLGPSNRESVADW